MNATRIIIRNEGWKMKRKENISEDRNYGETDGRNK